VASNKRIEIANKKAGFQFHVEEKYQAGMALTGSEVKSVRASHVNMGDAYCYFSSGELWIKNLHISEFKNAGFVQHEPLRERKLLLTSKELKKLSQKAKTKGYTIFPIRLFENERGFFKLEIGIGQGKKQFDKREDIKERDVKRDLERFK